MRIETRTGGRQTIYFKIVLSIHVAPPGDDTLHRGPVDEYNRLIFRAWHRSMTHHCNDIIL